MKGEWAYYRNHFSKETCEDIIRIAKSRPADNAKMGVDGSSINNDYRKSKIRFVNPNDKELGFLFPEIWKMAIETNDRWFDFHLSKIDYLQIAEYNFIEQSEYKKHHDVFWMNNDLKYHRKLSAIVQLSDPLAYEGGEFQLYGVQEQPKAEEIKSQGTVIFFPSFIEHAALPITKGFRYSIAVWIDGPKWK